MFRLIEPSSGQIQNTVLVHSMSAHFMCTHLMYHLLMVQWMKTVSDILIFLKILALLSFRIIVCTVLRFTPDRAKLQNEFV